MLWILFVANAGAVLGLAALAVRGVRRSHGVVRAPFSGRPVRRYAAVAADEDVDLRGEAVPVPLQRASPEVWAVSPPS